MAPASRTPEEVEEARRIVRAFFTANAVSASAALTRAELGLSDSAVLDALIDDGIVKRARADDERLYVPTASRSLFLPKYATKLSIIAFVLIVALIVALAIIGVPSRANPVP